MLDQPLQPFAFPSTLLSYLPDGLSAGIVITCVLYAVFVFWAIYTIVAIYHWLTYSHASWIAFPAIALHLFISFAVISFALPKFLVFAPPLAPYATWFDYHSSTDALTRALLGVWLLMTWTVAWGAFTRYFLNAWVLTNKRITTIKQRRFFNREVSSLLLPRVQDVTTNVTGVLSSLLGIGDIKVQSAGADIVFTMRGIPRPEIMRNLILKYIPEETIPVGTH